MLRLLLEALFYILPAYIANSSATLTMSIPVLKNWRPPIDFGLSLRGKRILGDGKTFPGLLFGTCTAILVGIVEYYLARHITFEYAQDLNKYSLEAFVILGGSLGFGALLGDMVKSFVKRRFGIDRGKPWIPFDQLDFLLGGILIGSIVYFPGFKIALILLIITPLAHFLSNVIAYKLKLKSVWW
ncbi:MAG: CDP-2,3-bis-(O-geranylgeranyl)-sn-glycerol synthase [Candidatus Dojkabacteria bacterium]|jgi:CDP-2,3-bis-(O-geranylgeranyl)-sn-glycerol synthase|nr:CDP-2,3-bis-(O-geranylgeranyl)-sn-glycerol synthase [Candidatus Dojkabacteria bacterium]